MRQYASANALNKEISEIGYHDDHVLESSKQKISKYLKGKHFTDTRRRGKYLILKTPDNWLLLHFGMTGKLKYFQTNGNIPEYSAMVMNFTNGHSLAYISKRKLGKVTVTQDVKAFFEEHHIGKDALEADSSEFKALMTKKSGGLKSALMDQATVSGIGNIYADEILFQEKLHPETKVKSLGDSNLSSLYNTMRRVMKIAIRHRAKPEDLPKTYLLSVREEGKDCPDCSGKINKITVNGRGTYICPDCQKLKKS